MCPNPQFPADLVTFIEEILNRKVHFLCSERASKGPLNWLTTPSNNSCQKLVFYSFLSAADLQATRSSHREVFCKKVVYKSFERFTGKHLCRSLFFNKVAGLRPFIKKEALAQVFSCEFYEISENTFFYRAPPSGCFCRNDQVWPNDLVYLDYYFFLAQN